MSCFIKRDTFNCINEIVAEKVDECCRYWPDLIGQICPICYSLRLAAGFSVQQTPEIQNISGQGVK